jgi:hypothetical protein
VDNINIYLLCHIKYLRPVLRTSEDLSHLYFQQRHSSSGHIIIASTRNSDRTDVSCGAGPDLGDMFSRDGGGVDLWDMFIRDGGGPDLWEGVTQWEIHIGDTYNWGSPRRRWTRSGDLKFAYLRTLILTYGDGETVYSTD